jgi:arginase
MVPLDISFLGIASQQGQQKLGLIDSPKVALSLMPWYWRIQSQNILNQGLKTKTVHCSEDLSLLDWRVYLKSYRQIRNNMTRGKFQINWGGDHGIAIATVAAFASLYSNGYVLWIDSRADLNTPESSPTGDFNGMPLSFLLGINEKPNEMMAPFWGKLDPSRLIYFGLQKIEPYEKYLIEKLGITTFFLDQVGKDSLKATLNQIKVTIANRPLHISFDISSVNSKAAPSTGQPCPWGLNAEHLKLLANKIGSNANLKSIDVVEINPEIGSHSEVKNTYKIAFDFLDQLFNANFESAEMSNFYLNEYLPETNFTQKIIL